MGAFEDDDDNSRINSSGADSLDFETQQIDSQYPDGDLEDDETDDLRYLTDTMPVDESYLFGDAFEAQFLNLAGETQVVDIGNETQAVDIGDETQVVDIDDETQVFDDLDCMKNMSTDFLNDFYTENVATDSKCEGANKIEAFIETQVLSQDADPVKTPRRGSFSGGFTSIRSASMRASGLAARERGTANHNNLCPTSKWSVEHKTCNKDSPSLAGCTLEPSPKNDNECPQTECIKDTEGPNSSNKCKIASATVRKLFEDDEFSEISQQIEPDNIKNADDNLDVASETCLAGLSYADSQEPGELSQAHALEVVDKFLDFNVMDFDERVGTIEKNTKKSKIVDSGAKGSRELAKKSYVLENPDCERGIYEWDDNREDDGGGDFFLKKKELFFEKNRCHTEPRKPKGDEKEKKCTKNILKDSAYSDSGPMLRKLRANGRKSVNYGEKVVQKNLVKDLEEQLNVGLNVVEKEKNEDDIIDPDTQMADGKAKKCTKKKLKVSAFSDSVSKNKAAADTNDVIGPNTQTVDGKEKKCTKKKLKGSVYSNSGSTLRKLRARGKNPLNCGKNVMGMNLVNDLDEQLNVGHKLNSVEEKKEAVKDVNDIIGPDTQMADEKQKKCTKNKSKGPAYSASGSMLRKMRPREGKSRKCGENMLQKDLVKDLDEQLNVEPEPKLVEEEKNEDVTDIGPDTQLAAEAMETLCFELLLADDNNNGNNPDTAKAICEKETSDITPRTEDHLTAKRPFRPSVGVVTRSAKQIKMAPVVSRANESSLLSKQSDLTGQRPEKKHHLEDHLDFSVPVARRTRKSTELHRSKAAAKTFDNRDETNHAISARVTRKSTVYKEMVGSNGPSAIDNNLPEKRSRQESIVQADAQYNNGRLKRSKLAGANFISTRSGKKIVHQNTDIGGSRHDAAQSASNRVKVGEKNDSEKLADAAKAHDKLEASPLPHATVSIRPMNRASPICMGDEYHKQSCRKNLSRSNLFTEINNVVTGSPGPYRGTKESRKRKDITSIRVLFSQHLDEDVVKHQKKVLAKLGGAVATFMSDATHFVAEEFMRTRNMLEAIASGKPVVTRLWLESCGQASCLIDEKNYILRDSRKEKEIGFCLPDSLSRASQYPILQGQKVFVTPNTKPGKDILTNLVKMVHGLVEVAGHSSVQLFDDVSSLVSSIENTIERVGRSIFNDEKLPDDLLILSCEEDYDVCVPFLEKGGAIYSSELLLNGIVKQKLEFERHRIFEDHVKKTRSTIWMKKNNRYLPVTKCK
ncbi:hypothetical protein CASFOL_012772 [Castilleja foliolosa]|uniref:BRCT domain-containing protein n=1 Tax=Castilleja foliolosa TaxID=1961234 RepID=A0ABD3DLD6_9LAMI